ncbi:MAG: tetratricopeptide repeat protein [Crocinitomicaceae bacterium]|nr:tetratricopeptide repeat protein [Crocinitomicaceae bacterium]
MFTNKTHEEATNRLKDGDIDAAIELYTQALSEAPDDYNIISDRGVAYLHKNDKLRCFGDFNRAIKLQPNYSYRYASRAFAKKHFGDMEGAIEDYEKAVDLDPEDAIAQNNLGMLLEEMGYKKQSQERFARADKLSEQENGLLDVMDDLEATDAPSQPSALTNQEAAQEVEHLDENSKESESGSKEFKKVFTSKNQFKEFIRFIRNGFKIK